MHWSARPFVRIFIFYVTGLILSNHILFIRSLSVQVLLLLIFGLLLASSVIYFKLQSYRLRWLNGLLIGLAVMFAGIFFSTAWILSSMINISMMASKLDPGSITRPCLIRIFTLFSSQRQVKYGHSDSDPKKVLVFKNQKTSPTQYPEVLLSELRHCGLFRQDGAEPFLFLMWVKIFPHNRP